MPDDELDLDLEMEAEAAQPKRRGLFGRFKKEPAAKAAAGDAVSAPAQASRAPAGPPRATGGDAAGGEGSMCSCKNFLIGLVGVIVLVLVVENWSPARLNFVGLHVDVPKSILLVIFFALGFGIAWWIFRRRGASQTSK